MFRADEIFLISENPSSHGVFDTITETKRSVFAEVRSVGYREFYEAKNAGINPEIIFVLSDWNEYDGEKVIEWDNRRYRVVRTYVTGMTIEITVEEATNDR